MSQPQMVPLAYGNHTITIEHELHAPVYVYLLHDHKTKDLTMGDPCEHRLNGVCVSSTHAKLYNHGTVSRQCRVVSNRGRYD
jgi:hypothetical protein